MAELNYLGKIQICDMDFSYANVSFSMRQVSTSSENIYSGKIQKRKGWKTFCNVDLFITNKTGEAENLITLTNQLTGMGKGGSSVWIEGYSEDGNTVVFNQSFDVLESDINYSDYLSNNSKLGLKFSFSISNSAVRETILPFWKDTINPYVLSYDILIEEYTASNGG